MLITGRLDRDEINVGGAKVSAGVVRDVLQAHPDVAWARGARPQGAAGRHHGGGRRRTDLGRDRDPDTAGRSGRWCQERLPEYGVPRRIKLLDAIPPKETLKSDV